MIEKKPAWITETFMNLKLAFMELALRIERERVRDPLFD